MKTPQKSVTKLIFKYSILMKTAHQIEVKVIKKTHTFVPLGALSTKSLYPPPCNRKQYRGNGGERVSRQIGPNGLYTLRPLRSADTICDICNKKPA